MDGRLEYQLPSPSLSRGPFPDSPSDQGQNLAVTVLYAPCSLDSGTDRVRSDRPLGELSSGREVPPEPPENWLNLNRRSRDISSQLSDDFRRCLIKTLRESSVSAQELLSPGLGLKLGV